jgi:hypothetical protein
MTSKPGSHLKDSTVAQISAAIFYQANVVAKITKNKQFQNAFSKVIFEQIEKDFGLYLDAQARIKPKQFHHVYEWKKTGNKNNRLFKLYLNKPSGLSFNITTDFLDSKTFVPSRSTKNRHVFIKKAFVMEKGDPVKIAPKASERLVFEAKGGYTVFMPKGASVTVLRPGGNATTGSYKVAYKLFFTGNLVNLSIKKSGVHRLFNSSLTQAMKLPVNIKKVSYSFSANSLASQADMAVSSAFGGRI